MGAVSLGYGADGKRMRRKVSGKTKQEVRAKLQTPHQELNAGVKSSSTYTVRQAVGDWLREGLDGTSDRTRTLYVVLSLLAGIASSGPSRLLSYVWPSTRRNSWLEPAKRACISKGHKHYGRWRARPCTRDAAEDQLLTWYVESFGCRVNLVSPCYGPDIKKH